MLKGGSSSKKKPTSKVTLDDVKTALEGAEKVLSGITVGFFGMAPLASVPLLIISYYEVRSIQ